MATTDSGHGLPVAPNVLNRQFTAECANEKWCGDITYVWTSEGWLYLAVVLNLFSRRVRVWGDNGGLCRPYVNRFPVGSTWAFALNRAPGKSPSAQGGYYLSVCGEYWLKVQEGKVVGRVTVGDPKAAPQMLPLERLRQLLK